MFSALSFSAPFILLALAALPAIWFLLRATPPTPKRIDFPAFVILRNLVTKEETPDRTPWWLLLMRLALAALIILALSGPILNAPPTTPGAGPLVLVIDDSWAAAQHWSARRDAIKESAAAAMSSDREVFIITTAPQETPSAIEAMTGAEADERADRIKPQPLAGDRQYASERLASLDEAMKERERPEIRWFSDGVASDADALFAEALRERGALTVFVDENAPKLRLTRNIAESEMTMFTVTRLSDQGDWEGALTAIARDGRELARIPVVIASGERESDVPLDLPLALRNELASVRIESVSSAGATYLADARDRRMLIGLPSDSDRGRSNLLSGVHYVRQALAPYAAFIDGNLDEIISSDASVIVLDDIGRLRTSDAEALTQWVARGGVLIRFAGPVLAEAAQDGDPTLMPVQLRGGGRAFGGALTWDTPQPLDDFNTNGPFSILAAPDDVFVRQQVLAQPGGETTARTWAQLQDGTPLVTGVSEGDGVIVLFHVTGTPEWSDLPLSGAFVDMLRRLAFLSSLGPQSTDENAQTRHPPLRLMDGFGALNRPGDTDPALTLAEISEGPAAERTPGFYGASDAAYSLNAVAPTDNFEPISISGVDLRPYEAAPPVALFPPLFVAAVMLLLADAIATLWLSGKLRIPVRAATAAMIVAAFVILLNAPHAYAQPLDPPIAPDAAEAALETRLAYVATGDPAMDRLSEQALAGLSRELIRRTAIEPAAPARINLETDDLSVYPFLYWPIVPGAEAPSDAALDNVENFMRFGGLILFDTRDDERAVSAGSTPEARALQRIVSQLNIPPLNPVPEDHVLTRSFYLLGDLVGRTNNNPVWVQAATTGANDGVTPVIIGGRDWAGAWAADNFGRPVRPMSRGGERARELSYRAGVNIVMLAFTGNYKSDQVHTPILLRRLGNE